MGTFDMLFYGLIGSVVAVGLAIFVALLFRRVVATNEVHIVQSGRSTTSYGKDTGNGNTYYEWPSFIPVLGVTKITLPVSVFDLDLDAYEAYDVGRLPFVVDVKAFFRITDSNVAAQRVSSFQELQGQLQAVVQGAVRSILASSEIEVILQGRSEFGERFTQEVDNQLTEWGVQTVKNIELMDIRDSRDSKVIANIMEKKKSMIEMQSRSEVANNIRAAQIAEIEARRDVDMQTQQAKQAVGLRTVEAEREVQVQSQMALQTVKEQERITAERIMEVQKVNEVRTAEITRDVEVVKAEQDKQTTILVAEGQLEAKRREAQGIQAEGEARADAEKAMQLAPVEAQIVLAKEIGENQGYQNYLVTIRQVEASETVGVQQARALEKADVKVISNTGNPVEGVTNVMELFTSKGGTSVGAMLEGIAQTENGKALLDKFGVVKK